MRNRPNRNFVAAVDRSLLKGLVEFRPCLGCEFVAQRAHGVEIEKIAPPDRSHGCARPAQQDRTDRAGVQGLLHGADGLAQDECGFGSGELGGMGHSHLLI